MLDLALKRNYFIKFLPQCPSSGWKIDATLKQFKNSDLSLGVSFNLREDVCYNIDKGREQPLILQKLMLKQITGISGMKTLSILESELTQSNDVMDFLDRKISKEFMKMQKYFTK